MYTHSKKFLLNAYKRNKGGCHDQYFTALKNKTLPDAIQLVYGLEKAW